MIFQFLDQGGTAEQAEASIIGSPEYLQLHGGTNTGFLTGVYQDVLSRAVDPSGAQAWGTALANGVSRQGVAAAILGSLESDQDEVQSLDLQLLQRAPESFGLDLYTNALQHGMSNETGIAFIAGSPEYYQRAQA
jgi:hypothetical protein